MDSPGERIRALRKAKGYSLEQLGVLCGVNKAAVQKWESGDTKNMKNEPLLLLARALGTDPAYIVWGPDRKPTRPLPEPPIGTDTTGNRFKALKR